jgi:DinB superfamily
VLGHVTDAERVFAYRALSFARGAEAELPGFDEDAFARAAACDRLALPDLLDDYAAVRAASLALLRRLDAEAWQRQGVANGKRISVRALAWLTAGHELHHRSVLRERYNV